MCNVRETRKNHPKKTLTNESHVSAPACQLMVSVILTHSIGIMLYNRSIVCVARFADDGAISGGEQELLVAPL